MSRGDDNAYPIPGLHADPQFNGLSIREHFAAMAMQGLCARKFDQGEPSDAQIACWAVTQADALLAELAKGQPK